MEGSEILPAVQSPMEIISQAIKNGAGEKELAIIERMFDFDLRVKAQSAKEAFFEDFANAAKTAPSVSKDKTNAQFGSKYTSLENMLNVYKPHYAEYGFTITFPSPTQTDNSMTAFCKIAHRLGHEETTSMTAPFVVSPVGKTSGRAAMNPQQAMKATFTYLRSATLEGALGIAGTDATLDDDGNLPVEYINDQSFADITTLIQEVGAKEAAFCKYMRIESIDKMPATLFKKAVTELERKRK